MVRKVLQQRSNSGNPRDKIMYDKIAVAGLLTGNVGMILTNGDLLEVKKILDTNRVQAPARQGALAPLDGVPRSITSTPFYLMQ